MTKKESPSNPALYSWRGKLPLLQLLPLSLQHVLAMVVGCVTPAIVVSGVAGLSQADSVLLIQSSLLMAAIATVIQIFPAFRWFGSGLPVIIGVSFSYLPALTAIAGQYPLSTVFGAQIIGGIAAILVGAFMKPLRQFFPPLVSGIVVFTIGLSLYPTAINYMAGGVGAKDYGSWQNWLVAFFTLTIVTVLNHYGKGIVKTASILFGMIIGYLFASLFGMTSLQSVASASFIQLPQPLHFGIQFEASSAIIISVLFVINAIQAIGDFSAVTIGGYDREPVDQELQGGVIANGAAGLIGALIGGLPTATYSQNVGIVSTTKVVNRSVFGLSSAIILLAALMPKFSALLTTIPKSVLGGATISVFAIIAMNGLKLIHTHPIDVRGTSVVGLSVALGVGITSASAALASFPPWVTTVFGKSPVVVATLVAIFLNETLPGQKSR